MTGLVIRQLAKSFGAVPVLRDVSLAVAPLGFTAVLGASGSGKTTLLRLIAGFERPDAGEIRIGDETVASAAIFRRPEQRGIGYVPQEGALFPHLSVADNITFGLCRAQRRARARVAELLGLVGLAESYAGRAPHELSGGEQQRVALARALAPKPRLLLLDEPFSALDAGLREQTREAVAAAIRAAGATAILVTHDQEEALSLGREVVVLRQGMVAQSAPPRLLYRYPASAEVARFVGTAGFLDGIAAGAKVRCALGELSLANAPANAPAAAPAESAVTVMIRPEQIKLAPAPVPGGIAARVGQVRFLGHDAVLQLSLAEAGAPAPCLTARVFGHNLPEPGATVWVRVEGAVTAYAEPPPA